MPSIKSAEKRVRTASKRRLRNNSVRSEVKTNITKAEKLVHSGDLEAARVAVGVAISTLDTAAKKGILHSNNSARRKSRLMKKLNQVLALSAVAPEVTEKTEPEAAG
ncbi:30S ribosomal protein S20 [Chloroflexota bacterium]